uniref:Uncharacterized protein n=1 Tax=Arundo donax TaxID=35708 RepID=A0A0A8ZUM9_ARUDO
MSIEQITSITTPTQVSCTQAVREQSPLAPAVHHICNSSLASSSTPARLGDAPSNTHRLWCLQRDQAPKMMREFSPCRACPLTAALNLLHQSSKEETSTCGARVCNPTRCSSSNQNCHTKIQVMSK